MLANHRPPPLMPDLTAGLRDTLQELRARRRFDPARYVEAKAALVRSYLARSEVSAAVVGVSGGIDSAVVLGLLRAVATPQGSPLRRVVGVLAPVFSEPGATNQAAARERGRAVIAAFEAEAVDVDLTDAHAAVGRAVECGIGVEGGPWAAGQLVSTIRTRAFYYVTSLLAQQGQRPVLCGTTNRDEGSYIGFFGKASDAIPPCTTRRDGHTGSSVPMPLPTRDELRRELACLDATQQKLVGGVLAVLFRQPERVRDREWVAEQFTQVTLLAAHDGGLGGTLHGVEHAHEGVDVVQEYVRRNIDRVLNVCVALFVHVADDVRGTARATVQGAMLQALTYFDAPGRS
jgi:hypothetical protein